MKTIDWKDWEIFCRVVEAGSFTHGAELAEVPKSSASAAIARLEALIGSRLLERTTRRVRVTESGQQLYARVAPHFVALREISAEAASANEQVSGTLRIATPYEIGSQHLAPSLTKLMALHPNLNVEIDVTWDQPDLLKHGYDLAFVTTHTTLHDSSLASKRVVLIERAFYAAPAVIEARGLPRAPEDIVDWPMLGNADDRRWEFWRDGFEVATLQVAPRMRTHNADIRRKAAEEGLGVARLSPKFVEEQVRQGTLVRVLPAYTSSPLKVYVLMPARKLMPAAVRALLDLMERSLAPAAPPRVVRRTAKG